MRSTGIRDAVEGITPKVLTETLRIMEEDGLLTRTDHGEQPRRVEYELTELGRSLIGPLRAVRAWAEQHVPDILEARARAAVAASGSGIAASP